MHPKTDVKKVVIPLYMKVRSLFSFVTCTLVYLPSDTDTHCNVQWDSHLSKCKDPLVLQNNGDFDPSKAHVICDDTPEEILYYIRDCCK
jgi:hypothetical protein